LFDGEEKIRRYIVVAKKWAEEFEKNQGWMEVLRAVKELGLRLEAENKSSDEDIGELILALRRE